MDTKLKICGITTLADARYCAGAGVDYLGFIQYVGSPRYIAPNEAKEIIEWLYGPEAVGVFVNESVEAINEAVEQTGFTMAQIHGDLPPSAFTDISCPTIKALSVHPDTTEADLRDEIMAYQDFADFFLLDTGKAGYWGGTGETFNWSMAQQLAADYDLFIAGGLNASNVYEVIETLNPYAIDLSSGVEESPGKKDFDKLGALFDAIARDE